MRFAIIFGIYGVALGAVATAAGAFGAVLAWTAASCLLVATAYATDRPRLLGKQDDGTQRLGAVQRAAFVEFVARRSAAAQGSRA
ncbi:MAG: hypothetical protein K8T90_04585 [Planctomycetes bacterium]|nr:hypothetical protein [Planctomycetota bacterium]